ncbi:MAG: BtpA/SgcQ family protein, partial [Anaerolineales bacterium]
MDKWLKDLFKVDKPVIAMVHMRALPGDPGYDPDKGLDWIYELARKDLLALQEGGVDAVMFSNEFSLPYLTEVEPITTASMAALIAQLKIDLHIPFGVNVLWDPIASIDLAVATGASFVREIFTGVYGSDFGLWNTNCGEVIRHQVAVNGQDVRLFFNIVPESAAYLGSRDIADIARSTVFNTQPDAICVSGLTAG